MCKHMHMRAHAHTHTHTHLLCFKKGAQCREKPMLHLGLVKRLLKFFDFNDVFIKEKNKFSINSTCFHYLPYSVLLCSILSFKDVDCHVLNSFHDPWWVYHLELEKLWSSKYTGLCWVPPAMPSPWAFHPYTHSLDLYSQFFHFLLFVFQVKKWQMINACSIFFSSPPISPFLFLFLPLLRKKWSLLTTTYWIIIILKYQC